ncbi:MAG: hypothetical protein J3Q66DRAFT_371745 [Benniella sp.]|nr:MAG: hypothetical protein J3Q66DRAFT_371745 [Benniella sp.]
MGQGFLQAIRGCLVLFAFITFILTIQFLSIFGVLLFNTHWDVWLPLLLAILSIAAYSWAIKAQRAQRNIIQSNTARYTCSLLLCAAWLASPSYTVDAILGFLRRYNRTDQFFEFWNCDSPGCGVSFVIDLFGFIIAFLVFVEMIFAYHERSSNVHEAGTLPTTIVVASGPVQQYPAQPVQQIVYNPVQQPGQPPAAYYPQPVMYQTPTMPYQQGPTTIAYQVPQQAPAYQPYPTPTQ